VLAIEIAAAGV